MLRTLVEFGRRRSCSCWAGSSCSAPWRIASAGCSPAGQTAQFVWRAWNVLGALLLGLGVLGMAYAWGALGLQSGWGSLLLGLGLLLASAGLWMLVPV